MFAATGTTLLIAGFFASKANRKFTTPSTIYYNNAGVKFELWGGIATINNMVTVAIGTKAILAGTYQLITYDGTYLYMKPL